MSKKSIFLISLSLVLGLVCVSYGEPNDIWLDFDDANDVNTHPGCTSFLMSDSGSMVNDITIDLFGNLDDRRRDEPNNPGSEVLYGDNIYRDFVFGLYPSPANITLWELGAGQDCNITLWSFDNNSEPNRIARWYSNGVYIFTTNFTAGELPWCIENPCPDGPSHAYDAVVTADAFGRIRLTSVMDPNSAGGTHFAFVNALRVIPGAYTSATTYAHRPIPYDGEEDVVGNVILKWRKGSTAATRDVYLGTSFDDVNNATRASHPGVLLSQAQSPNNLDPYGSGFLKLDATYYWRVDEVIGGTPQKGEVWNFETEPYHVLEDWNSYATTDDLRDVWQDYYTPQEEPLTSAECYIDMTIVRSGNSMRYFFRNYDFEPYYSEVRANMTTGSAMDPNWQGMNAKALSLWFYGDVNNLATEPMYMILKDGNSQSATVTYPDTNDLAVASWQQWNITLSSFTNDNPSLNLKNIAQIVIRFGEPNGPQGNNGTVYFDDLRLYPTRCVLAERNPDIAAIDYIPGGAVSGDCVIDHGELKAMADTWLAEDDVAPATNPGEANLVAYYPLDEGDGNNVEDVVGDHNGTLTGGVSWITPGLMGSGAVHFDASAGTRIEVAKIWNTWDPVGNWNAAERTGDLTVAIWAKWEGPRADPEGQPQGLICKRGGWSDDTVRFMFECDSPPGDAHDPPEGWEHSFALRSYYSSVYSPEDTITPFTGQWAHYAATCQGHTVRLYVNGREIPQEELLFRQMTDNPMPGIFSFGLGDANSMVNIGNNSDSNSWEGCPGVFKGALDEARIYNRALEPNEIAYLADTTPGDGYLHIPVPSAAEIWAGEPEGERVVNFRDFAMVADLWLEEDMFE